MPPPIELDLADAVAVYLDRCESERLAVATFALYRIVLKQFVTFAGRQNYTRIDELTLELELAWQRYMRTEQVNDLGRRCGAPLRTRTCSCALWLCCFSGAMDANLGYGAPLT